MHKTQTVCLAILTTIAVGFSLFYLKTVLLPFVIALFFVIGCRPVLAFLESNLQLSRWVAFVVAFSIGAALLVGFALTTWLSIQDFTEHSEAYQTRLNTIADWIAGWFAKAPDPAPLGAEPGATVADAETVQAQTKETIDQFFEFVSNSLQSQLLQFASALSGLLSYGILILIYVFFLLLGQEQSHQRAPRIIRDIESQVRQYLVMKTLISAVTGFAFGFVLWRFGVPLAILLGFLAFLLNFIPNIGPLISTLTPVPFLILNAEMAPWAAIVCFVLVSAIQFISGNVVEPRIMGKSFDVSPVVLLLALMFFGLVWGIIGMFLATPIASILKIVLQRYQTTKPISELMAGRWVTSETQTA